MAGAFEISIGPGIGIPESDVRFVTSRASGPGGQNVNKVETRVTLVFDLAGTAALDEDRKEKVRERLATRVSKAGELRVTAQRERSQSANRELAIARFQELLRDALSEAPPRRPSKVPRGQKRRRLQAKKRRGEIKRLRSGPVED